MRIPIPSLRARSLPEASTVAWGITENGTLIPLAAIEDDTLRLAYDWPEWESHVLHERYATWRRRPIHTRLPFSYRIVPSSWRHRLAARSCRRDSSNNGIFPSSLDGGFEALRSLVRRYGLPSTVHEQTPRIVLTHDVDTAEGINFIQTIADAERALGLRSSWNFVVDEYPIDHSVADWLKERGFEIGLHDLHHDNKLAYLPEEVMRQRLTLCGSFIDRHGVRGFRSPSWLRSPELMRVLPEFLDYDCSCLDFDRLSPAGRGGVLTPLPFMLGELVEIPTTIPFEAPLLWKGEDVVLADCWNRKIEWLSQVHGHAVVNTHPDPHYLGNHRRIKEYALFLERLLERFHGHWSLPRDLAREVRRADRTHSMQESAGHQPSWDEIPCGAADSRWNSNSSREAVPLC